MAGALCDNESKTTWARGEEAQAILCKAQLVTEGQQHTSASPGPPDYPLHGDGWQGYRLAPARGWVAGIQITPYMAMVAGTQISPCTGMGGKDTE